MSIQLDPIQIPLNQDESVKDFLANCKKQKSVPVLESENVTSKQSLMLIPTVSQVFCYISRPIADIYAQKCSDDFPSPGGATPLHDVIWGYALYHRLQLGPSRARVDYVELRKSQMADAQHSAAARQHLTAQELQVFLDARYKNEFQRCFGCMDTSLFFQKAFSLALPITDISQLRKYLGEIELKENWVKDQFQFPLYASFCEDNWPTGEAIPHVSKAKIGGLKWCEVDDQKAEKILQLAEKQVQVQTFQELVQVNFNQIEAQEQKNKKYTEEAAKIFKQLEEEKNTEQEPKNLQWLKKNCYKIEIEEVASRAFSLSLAEFVELQGCIDFVEGAKAILTPQMRDCCLKQEEIPIEEMPGWMLKVDALGLRNFFSEEEVAGIWDLKRRKKMAQIRPDCKWGSLAKKEEVQQSNVENPTNNPPKFYEVNVEPKQVQRVELKFETPKKVNLEANPENKEDEFSQLQNVMIQKRKPDDFLNQQPDNTNQEKVEQKEQKVNLKLEIDYERDIEQFQNIVPKLSMEEAAEIRKHFQMLEEKLLPEKMVQILKGYEPKDGDKNRQAAWKTFEEKMELREFQGYVNNPEMLFILSKFDFQTPDIKSKKINLDLLEYIRFYQLLDRFGEQSKQSTNYKILSGQERKPAVVKEEPTNQEKQNPNAKQDQIAKQNDQTVQQQDQSNQEAKEDKRPKEPEIEFNNKPIREIGKPELIQMFNDLKNLPTLRKQIQTDFEEIVGKGIRKTEVMQMDDEKLEELAQVCETDFGKVNVNLLKLIKSKVWIVKLCYLFEDMLDAVRQEGMSVPPYLEKMKPELPDVMQESNFNKSGDVEQKEESKPQIELKGNLQNSDEKFVGKQEMFNEQLAANKHEENPKQNKKKEFDPLSSLKMIEYSTPPMIQELNECVKNKDLQKFNQVINLFNRLRTDLTCELIQKIVLEKHQKLLDPSEIRQNLPYIIIGGDAENQIIEKLNLPKIKPISPFNSTEYAIDLYLHLDKVGDKSQPLYKAFIGEQVQETNVNSKTLEQKIQQQNQPKSDGNVEHPQKSAKELEVKSSELDDPKPIEVQEQRLQAPENRNQDSIDDEGQKCKDKKYEEFGNNRQLPRDKNQVQENQNQKTGEIELLIQQKDEKQAELFGFSKEDFVQIVKDSREISLLKKQIKTDFDEIVKLGKTKEEVLKMTYEELEELAKVCKTDFGQINKDKVKIITSKLALVELCYVFDDMLEAVKEMDDVPTFIKGNYLKHTLPK